MSNICDGMRRWVRNATHGLHTKDVDSDLSFIGHEVVPILK
jgi:hypothetical protein